jgi:hypothetical protein
MAGEFSKKIGDEGEKIVDFIFGEVLNFKISHNLHIDCNRPEEHKRILAKSGRTTHGIDGLIYYVSPLQDYILDIGVISSKCTSKPYPSSAKILKEYIKDLAETLECFNYSKEKSLINQNASNVKQTETIGILVWHSFEDDLTFDLVSKTSNIHIENELSFDKIILLDNNRLNFLFESIYISKQIYGTDNIDFVYHNTGLNFTRQQEGKMFGKEFPIQYLYSNIILLRITNKKNTEFHIYVNELFDIESFNLLIGFIKQFDYLETLDRTIIYYREYNGQLDNSLGKQLSQSLQKIEVKGFPINFRNIN